MHRFPLPGASTTHKTHYNTSDTLTDHVDAREARLSTKYGSQYDNRHACSATVLTPFRFLEIMKDVIKYTF